MAGERAPWLRILGPLRVTAELGSEKQRALLGLLALTPGRSVGRDEIIDVLWDGTPPVAAANSLQVHVSRLRRTLAVGGVLVSVPGGYRLDAGESDLDLVAWRSLIAAAGAEDEPDQACETYAEAAVLWRGALLADVPALHALPGAAAIRHEHAASVTAWADAAARAGRHGEVIPALRELVAAEPWDGPAHARLMIALAGTGRRPAALEVYARLRERLADELGTDPDDEVTAAYERILRHESARPPATVPRQLPAARPHFAGRRRELTLLDDVTTASGTACTVLISGSAGVGKTTLALTWAHRATGRFPDGQLYLNLRGFDPAGVLVKPEVALRDLLDALGVPGTRIPAGSDARAALYRSLTAGRRMLLVLDNARSAEQVRPLLPGAAGCVTVVTSRDRMPGLVAADGAVPVPLDVLDRPEAYELLAARLGPARLRAEPEAVAVTVELCARLPLALAVVATRAALHPGFRLAALATQLEEAGRRLDGLGDGDPATDPRAVFSWSCRALSPPAARLFRLLGVPTAADISGTAAAALAGLPERTATPLLAELDRAHLITETIPGRYTFHDLLRAYAQELARETGNGPALTRLLDHYLQTAQQAAGSLYPYRKWTEIPAAAEPISQDRALHFYATEQAVLIAAITQAHEESLYPYVWQLAFLVTEYLDRAGSWTDLAAVQELALDAARRAGNLPAEAQAHYDLGFAYTHLDRHDRARTHLRAARDACESLGDRTGQARAHLEIARAEARESRHHAALDHARRALTLLETEGNRTGQARALNAVGWYHALLGEHHRALDLCRQAITLHQSLGNERGEAGTWQSLGYANHHLGRHDEAVACYHQAIDLCRSLGDRYNEADTLLHLGDTHQSRADHRSATKAWRQALEILTDLDHPDAAQARTRLSITTLRAV
ncbi:AfsR/SARP family transcriptional regulator [Winogradskya consettensis]|uniref:AfsR/SARP family transcriptional regulator n=1 Tax=Winogradskya consettensis TaxID=113560 RepID=UPI001BB4527E|nr:BTAD domain-containing putative transcriptional regulator [Actinoplanes consettensis]